MTTVAELVAKMQGSGRYVPISEDEFQRLYFQQQERNRQEEAANYKPDYSRIGMKEDEMTLDWSAVKPGISDGMKAVEAVKPMYERGYGILFLWGNWGQAKTLVGKVLTATAFRDGRRAAYANMLRVLDDIRLAFDSDERKTTELIRRMDWWVDRDILFIDELDKTNNTSWASERLFELIDRRYVRAVREEALTVIASNKSTAALDGYIQSRLSDSRVGQIVELSGKDARKVMPEGYHY